MSDSDDAKLVRAVKRANDRTKDRRDHDKHEQEGRRCGPLSECVRDIVLFVRRDGRVIEANKAAEDAYGYSRDELLSLTINDLRAPGARSLSPGQMARARAEGILFETIHRRKDNTTFPVELSVTGAKLGGQDILLSIIRSTNGRRQLEAERERSVTRERVARDEAERRAAELATVIESTNALLALLDRDFNFRMVNSAYAEASGHTKQELIGHNHFALFPNPENQAIFERVRDTGIPYRATEKPFEYADQPWRGVTYWNWILVPIKDDRGRVEELLLSLVDVTPQVHNRQQIQELAQKAERRASELDATLNSISDGLIIYGPQGEIARMNRAAEGIMGFTFDQLKKMPRQEQDERLGIETEDGKPVPPEQTPRARALRGETVAGYRMVMHRPDGRIVHLMSSTGPIRDAQGRIVGAVANLSDITQLVELIRLRDEIASTVAHDIRQPLTIIQGQAQVADRMLAANRVDSVRQSIEAIITSSRRMNAMIQDLVDSVRMEAGQLELHYQSIDFADFLTDLLQRSSASLDIGRVRLSVARDLPPVLADPDRLERIVLNLLSNALKYSDPGTPVDLRVTRQDGRAVVAVQDRGQGIAPEDLPHVFDRYYRPKGQRKGESIGLGLYISRMLVEAHGGNIWAESKPGEGSTFYFTLPLRDCYGAN